jgi:ubiquinone/menaquinone biosynthesis C-methylase UbiE
VDYDATSIPAGYDRARALTGDLLQLWMDTVATFAGGREITTVLDLGCGTGRFTQALAERFGAEVVGIDPSAKMLDQARAKAHRGTVRYAAGAAEALPLPNDSVDLIFASMVFHHFPDPTQAARECCRVLREQGTVFVRSGTREHIESYPYVPFFPTSRPILLRRLPSRAFIQNVFETAGLRTLQVGVVTQQSAPTLAAYADRVAAGGDSILAELDLREFERGLTALRDHASRVDPQPAGPRTKSSEPAR